MASLLRQAVPLVRSQARALSTSRVVRKDLVQDLYLRELKAYKPPVKAQDAHVGQVKNFSAPAAPQAPALPADLASELAAYDASEPVIEAAPKVAETSAEGAPGGAQEFLAHLEADIPEEEHHH
ncbi:hypothetical protein FRC02_010669 [Tulasnella sp. 418]|nr:hypothetical protein FRC02_010669 [Tulasnella sp. 418]